jgi:cytochrome P450
VFDAYDPEFVRDPYPTYASLRTHGPFHDETWGLTFFSRHADVTGILRSRAFGRDIRHVLPADQVDHRTYPAHLPRWTRLIRGSFIDLEPPEHTRIRGSVNRAFTRRRAEMQRSDIRALAERLLDGLGTRFDVIADYATPMPISVIADMMGVPDADHQRLLDWSHAIVRVFDIAATEAEQQRAEQAVGEFADYLRHVLERRRDEPGDDLISELVHSDDPLPDDDLVASCILILNAGHEATVHGIGNSVLTLTRHAEAFGALADDPDRVSGGADELLRFDAPLQMFERWVLEPVEWSGIALDTGDKVGLLFGSANRDEAVFTDPDAVQLGRDPNPHVSFGLGTHFCLGSALARVELEEALRALAMRFSSLEALDPEPERTPSLVFRGVRSLRVAGRPR